MNIRTFLVAAAALVVLLAGTRSVTASEAASPLEKSMSDTLDIWREGRYEQLFEKLAHRGKTSRETFVRKMSDSTIRPACCWQKMENFRIINEKLTEATVYAKIGLDTTSGTSESTSREFKLTHQEGVWKMQLADVVSIAGVNGKKRSSTYRYSRKISPYHD